MEYSISFCTVCMNRLHHIRQTLPVNIYNNSDYKNLEFVLLDYNSSDLLEQYIKEELIDYINNGRLTYYKTVSPVYFHRSHSRNVACKLASSDIIVNIDADNFTGKGFAKYVNSEFNIEENIYLSAINGQPDVAGRICLKKCDFDSIKGYDEKMGGYGFEDHDLIHRLENANLKNKRISMDGDFLFAINHDNEERLINEYAAINFSFMLFQYLTPNSTEIIIFFKDGTCKIGTVIKNNPSQIDNSIFEFVNYKSQYRFSVIKDIWEERTWSYIGKDLYLFDMFSNSQKITANESTGHFTAVDQSIELHFYRVYDRKLIEEILMFYSQVSNRYLMEANLKNKHGLINEGGFGNAIVYKNFDYNNPISV